MDKDLKFIKKFSKITTYSICKDFNISPNNLYSGKCKKENIIKVKKEIEKRFFKLYIEDYYEE